MKIKKLNLLLLLLFVISSTTSQAQSKYLNRGVFFEQNKFMTEFEKEAVEIYESKNFITVEDAQKQLKEVEGKRVKIKRVKPNNKVISPNQIYDKLTQSVVAFGISYDCGQCEAMHVGPTSGYVIDESGLIATNHHVIESYTKGKDRNFSMLVKLFNGAVYPVVEVVSSSPKSDLAIVRVDTKGDKLTPIPFGDDAQVGDDIFILSNPFNMLFYFTKGIVARNNVHVPFMKANNAVPEMEVTADYAVGSSGAPIVDNKGNLVSTVAVTRSVYSSPQEKSDMQMVVKGTRPVVLLKELVEF